MFGIWVLPAGRFGHPGMVISILWSEKVWALACPESHISNTPGAGEFTGKSINISKADGINAAWL